MSSILIDIENQNESDEIAIHNSKVEILKSNADFIYYLFKTSIEYGSLAKNGPNTQTKDMTQWVCLYGEDSDRAKAKKYISAICNPAYSDHIQVNDSLLKRFENDNFRNDLISSFQANLFTSKTEKLKLIIEGTEESVKKTKSTIQNELDSYLKSNQDDDIILIDPYELFDTTNQIRPNRKMENFSGFKLKSQFEFENSFEQLNFTNKAEDPSDILIKRALEKGFKIDEIQSAFKELDINIKNMDEFEFIEYLKTIRNFQKKDNNLNKSDLEIIEIVLPCTSNSSLSDQKNKPKRKTAVITTKPPSTTIFTQLANKVLAEKNDSTSSSLVQFAKIYAEELQEKNPKTSKKAAETDDADYICLDSDKNSDSIMIIDDVTPIFDTKKPNFQNNQPIYNPAIYQDNVVKNDLKLNKKTRFSNFENSKVNKNYKQNRSRSNSARNLSDKNNNNKELLNANLNEKKTSAVGSTSNLINPCEDSNLRFIIIDGSNVAREHGKESGRSFFSCKGIKLCVDHFFQRGHTQIKVLVPRFRRGTSDHEVPTRNPEILDQLEKNGNLCYTPSRYVNNKLIIPYDDRFILKAAVHYNAIIVSNDNYRDLWNENNEWKRHIETSLLQYSFIGDLFMVADDPLGRSGPNIDQFLSNKNSSKKSQVNQPNKSNNKNKSSVAANQSGNNDKLKNIRNVAQTTNLEKKLKEIFPKDEELIKKVLNQNPNQYDINFFTMKILDLTN